MRGCVCGLALSTPHVLVLELCGDLLLGVTLSPVAHLTTHRSELGLQLCGSDGGGIKVCFDVLFQ